MKYWFITVSGKIYDYKPRTWEEADKKRDHLRNYYGPNVAIELESEEV